MLLANLTKTKDFQAEICPLLPVLFPIFLESKGYNPNASYNLLANVFAHLTSCKEGRLFFLENDGRNLFKILDQTLSMSVMRRGGSCSVIKNCLFETEYHRSLFEVDDEEDRLFVHLVGKLACPRSTFDEEDLGEMILDIQLEYRHTEAEEDAAIRALIMESLILLGTTRFGRDKMREKKIYPIFREWHKLEPEEVLKDLLEKVVDLMIRDESEQ